MNSIELLLFSRRVNVCLKKQSNSTSLEWQIRVESNKQTNPTRLVFPQPEDGKRNLLSQVWFTTVFLLNKTFNFLQQVYSAMGGLCFRSPEWRGEEGEGKGYRTSRGLKNLPWKINENSIEKEIDTQQGVRNCNLTRSSQRMF